MAYLFGLTPPISNVFRSRLSPPKENPVGVPLLPMHNPHAASKTP